MKRYRALSLFLVLALLMSLCSGLLTATAANAPKNTGVRHTVCEALSSAATAYYTGSNTFDTLIELPGSSSGSSVEAVGSDLYKQLSTLMSTTMTDSVSYSSLTSYWPNTDASNGSSDAVLFYSDVVSSSYNREHVWPKSRASFYQSGGGSDLHHLRPTNTTINSTRGNMTMGNVRGVISGYSTAEYGGKEVLYYSDSADLVEINDNIKGDVARIFLYVYVRWQERNLFENDPNPKTASGDTGGNNGLKVIESLDTLLQWCENDPVDTWEMSRNDSIETVQGNRNVFIDYPELAWLLFDRDIPDMDTPSGYAHEAQGPSFTLAAVSANPSMGSVSVAGKTVTATPTDGHYVSGYTLTPADAATVTRTGNTFRVSAMTADCTLTVNFAAKTAAELTYVVPEGVPAITANAYIGDTITLPTPTGTPADTTHSYNFIGWTAATVADTEEAPTYLAAGSNYTLTASSTTFYALYSYAVADGSGTPDTYTLASGVSEGSYVIVAPDSSVMMTNDISGNTYMGYEDVTISDDVVTNATASNIFTFKSVGSSYAIYDSLGAALYCTAQKNVTLDEDMTAVTAEDSEYLWNISIDNEKVATIAPLTASYGTLQYNSGSPRFTTYASTQKSLALYGGIPSTRYYTTLSAPPCEHLWDDGVVTTPATCTAPGVMTFTCSICNRTRTEAITQLEHSWDDGEVTKPATCTEPGVMTYTCSVGGETRTEEIAALEHDFVKENEDYFYTYYRCSRCGETKAEEKAPVAYEDSPSEEFSDIVDTWYRNGADYVINAGIMGSTSTTATTFEPNTNMTRAMLVSMLYRFEKAEPVENPTKTFTDVPAGQWYTEAVLWAAENKIVNGTGDGTTFEPNANITREQIALLLYNYCKNYKKLEVTKSNDLAAFSDKNEVSSWALAGVRWSVGEKLISGRSVDGKTTLAPKGNAMRCEIATLMMSFVKSVLIPTTWAD